MEKYVLLWHQKTPGGMIIGCEVEEISGGMDQLIAAVKRANEKNNNPENREQQLVLHQIVVIK